MSTNKNIDCCACGCKFDYHCTVSDLEVMDDHMHLYRTCKKCITIRYLCLAGAVTGWNISDESYDGILNAKLYKKLTIKEFQHLRVIAKLCLIK